MRYMGLGGGVECDEATGATSKKIGGQSTILSINHPVICSGQLIPDALLQLQRVCEFASKAARADDPLLRCRLHL